MNQANRDFFPNNNETKAFISDISVNLYHEIANEFTETNCGWIEYALRQGIVSLAKSRLYYITPSSQIPKPDKP